VNTQYYFPQKVFLMMGIQTQTSKDPCASTNSLESLQGSSCEHFTGINARILATRILAIIFAIILAKILLHGAAKGW
jgi:hypothetical protein